MFLSYVQSKAAVYLVYAQFKATFYLSYAQPKVPCADCSINGKQHQETRVDKRRKKSSAKARPCRLTTPRSDSTLVLPEQANFFVLFMSKPTCSRLFSQRLIIGMIIYLSNP